MILLGTGTSVGVPAIGCSCAVCISDDPKHNRTRASAILGLPDGNLLIDTSPDLRHQLLREQIGIVDSVIFTHEHADHIMGFDDLRLFQFYLGHAVPVYCTPTVQARLKKSFDYAFSGAEVTHTGAVPAIDLMLFDDEPLEILGAEIVPIPLKHGPRFDVHGFRIGNVAYCTDCNEIPDSSRDLLQGLDTLVLDGLRENEHATHFNIEQAVEVATALGAGMTWLTHCACSVDYKEVNKNLPDNIQISYDGLSIDLT